MTLFYRTVIMGALLSLVTLPAAAQGIDCTRARAPLDRAICASPRLLDQDRAMATAFAQALAATADTAALRQSQVQWLRDRAAACGNGAPPEITEACLLRFGTARLAVLAPQKTAAPTVPPPVPISEPLTAPAPPALSVEPAEARLERATLPAAEQMETLLHVTHPGRFALIAKSPTGTALQLVDMLTGPSETAGQAGQTDGRLDLLLDTGTYKLRAFGAAQATGDVILSVTPFRDAGPAQGAPMRGRVDQELGDFQQRRFWLTVAPDAKLRIEAAGRALGDLRLFHEGRDLAALIPTSRIVEPTAGHPLTDLVLEGSVPPGTYELLAYGGRPRTWANAWADGVTAQPFHLRTGASDALAAGWVAGRIGPFGSEVFAAPPEIGALRLDLPEPADARLRATDGNQTRQIVLDRRQREPSATLMLKPERDQSGLVEVSGAEGQPYQLRALSGVQQRSAIRDGSYWMSVDTTGLGGDEPPLTYVLTQRRTNARPLVRASGAPRIGPGIAWRRRFNLRGQAVLVFEVTAPGPVAVRAEGVPVQAAIAAFGAAFQARADGSTPASWDLAAGFYVLQLTPPRNAAGILDLTIGPPGLAGDLPGTPAATDPAIPVGLVTLDGSGQLDLLGTRAAGASVGLLARPAPVDLARGPLAMTLAAGAGIDVPVRLPADGTLLATEILHWPVAASFTPVAGPSAGRIGLAHVPAADHERTVALAWQAPAAIPAPIPPVPPAPHWQALLAGTPQFFDLDRDTAETFALTVPTGGLFRVETLGRLHTTGAIGSAYVPDLDHADGNGIGKNMLMQGFLRAGQYRVTVGATGSAGHLGVTARPAALATGATLVPGGSVRARLAADEGVVFPLLIAEAGTYHIDLETLAGGLTARLEDEAGWPILPADTFTSLDQKLLPGRYRLLAEPAGVAARVVARLARIEPAAARSGHGPFPLAFDSGENRNQWREPPGRDDPRTPDTWMFALAGEAAIKIAIGDGMVAELHRDGVAAPLGRFTHTAPFAGTMPPGRYQVTTTSLGRNDRLDYTIALASEELQPDRPRTVTVPATLRFAIAEDRVVSLTSFGGVPLRAVLRRADGQVVGRYGDRGDDWNIGISRLLQAGAYQLALAAAAPPDATDVPVRDPTQAGAPTADAAPDDTSSDAPDQAMGDQSGNDQATPADTAAGETDSTPSPSPGAAAPGDKKTEIRLALPIPRAPVAASTAGSDTLAGGGVHRMNLPASPDALLLAAASSTAELALALEQSDAAGVWHTVTITQGTAPVIGALGGADTTARRLSVWTVDGGAEPIRFAARVVTAEPQPAGSLTPVPVPLADLPQHLAAALVAVPGAGPVALDSSAGALTASAPGAPLAPVDGALLLPQSPRLWLITPDTAPLTLTAVTAPPDRDLALAIPPDGAARLPGAPIAAGHILVWRAQSGLGQPGLDAGRGMGVADGSALALAGEETVRVFNAGGSEPLRLRVAALDLADQAPLSLAGPLAQTLPPRSALPVRLPEGDHSVVFSLTPGTAAIAGWRGAGAVTVWSGDAAVTRTVEGSWTDVLLVNTGAAPAPVGLAWTRLSSPPLSLAPGMAWKRFFGAAGSIDMPVSGSGRLMVAGGAAQMIGPDGRVTAGSALPLAGAGRLVLTHGPGLVAAWIEGATSPWPEPPVQAVTLPLAIPLHDLAMTLGFTADTPMLLHARSTSPVILALGRGGPELFPSGAEFNRVIPAGPVSLRMISPHDGPLSGTIALSAEPIGAIDEGLGAEVAVAPGNAAAFGFSVVRGGPVGVGVRAQPDRLSVRLLAEDGHLVGEGIAQLRSLAPGRYVLEAQVPDDALTTRVRPAVIGIRPRPSGPPPDVVNSYLALVGLAPK